MSLINIFARDEEGKEFHFVACHFKSRLNTTN